MIKVAIVGIGNCASSLVQGFHYYKNNPDQVIGLMHQDFGGYKISDIEIVSAFDIDKRKVGKPVGKAIFSSPNCTKFIGEVPEDYGPIISRGVVLDGVANHMKESFIVEGEDPTFKEIVQTVKNSGAEILISYLPVGSAKASRFYAEVALEAGIGFINAIPEFICSDDEWIAKFKEKGLPCAGDDIKSQVGATIVHRVLARLINDRGQIIDSTFQLNVGGNTDFENMIDEKRLISKRKSKTQAVTSILDERQKDLKVKIGPSDYIPHLKDNKVCYINIKGRQFGDIPFELDLKLSVEDSPNSAGVMVDVIRAMKIALDRKLSGNLEAISSYAFKSPKVQYRDDEAYKKVEEFIGSKERLTNEAPQIIKDKLRAPYNFFGNKFADKEKTLLDIACGEGLWVKQLKNQFKEVILMDADKRHSEVQVADIRNIPLEDNSIDIAFSYETIEHVIEHEQVVSELIRVARDKVIIGSDNEDGPQDVDGIVIYKGKLNPFHIKELGVDAFEKLFQKYDNKEFYHSEFIDGKFVMLEGLAKGGYHNYVVINLK